MIDQGSFRSLALQTKRGRQVPNVQDLELPEHRRLNAEAELRQALGIDFALLTRRQPATATYNCHGMTFANRRTGIHELSAVDMILVDDGYREVPASDIIAGDVVLYYESDQVSHSGLVVEVAFLGTRPVPKVLSKWGSYGEYIHRVDLCPYAKPGSVFRFYRESILGTGVA
jgi:hypothetical protein